MICEVCGKARATQGHHKFPNTKVNRAILKRLMGSSKAINSSINIQNLCHNCHIGEAKGLIRWGEREFCAALGIETEELFGRFKIKTRGKDD